MLFKYNDPHIVYTGRFAAYDNTALATAAGSRFAFAFEGKMAILHFRVELAQQPYAHLWIRVDNGARVEAPIDRYLRISADGDGRHTVEVILKGMVEMIPRWYSPVTGGMRFGGVEADALVALPRRKKKKVIEFVGDSITEGVLIDAPYTQYAYDQFNRPVQDDITATYGWLCAEKLGLEPWMMGYGAVGVTKGGCGGVPCAAEAYPYVVDGYPVQYDRHPDYVFINHGSNDVRADAVTFTAGYVRLLDAILTAHPKTQVIAMSPFNGTHEEDIERLVAEYNERHQQHIRFVNGSHWLPKDPLHPLRDGHAIAADKLAKALADLAE